MRKIFSYLLYDKGMYPLIYKHKLIAIKVVNGILQFPLKEVEILLTGIAAGPIQTAGIVPAEQTSGAYFLICYDSIIGHSGRYGIIH